MGKLKPKKDAPPVLVLQVALDFGTKDKVRMAQLRALLLGWEPGKRAKAQSGLYYQIFPSSPIAKSVREEQWAQASGLLLSALRDEVTSANTEVKARTKLAAAFAALRTMVVEPEPRRRRRAQSA